MRVRESKRGEGRNQEARREREREKGEDETQEGFCKRNVKDMKIRTTFSHKDYIAVIGTVETMGFFSAIAFNVQFRSMHKVYTHVHI